MSGSELDLIVIGAGSGGLATAKRAASYGARVAIVEADRVGGTCVIRGCVPKKLMVYAAGFGSMVADAAGYGWSHSRGTVDWAELAANRNEAVASLERAHEGHLERAGVALLRGRARVTGPRSIVVGDRQLSAPHLLVATGSEPILPEIDGIEHAITSDGFFELSEQPRRVAIVGSGYIAVELASIFAGLGSRVTLIIRRDLPLRFFDEDLRREALEALRAQGIEVHVGTRVERIERNGATLRLHTVSDAAGAAATIAETVLYAVGRRPRTRDLGLSEVGVELGSDGEVIVDGDAVSSVPSILAIGDVIDHKPLTPVAIQAGRLLADRLFGGKDARMSYVNVPTAVFSNPPIATVGLTEQEAEEELGADGIAVYKARFTPLLHMLTERKETTLVKLVVDARTDRVLGCHMIGHDAPEIIQGLAVAVIAGATKKDFDRTVGIHPTVAEEFVTLT